MSGTSRSIAVALLTLIGCAEVGDGEAPFEEIEAIEEEITLAELGARIQGTVARAGGPSDLAARVVAPGVYEVTAAALACTPGTSGCEPDRYQITFPRSIAGLYGMGHQASAGKVTILLDQAIPGGAEVIDLAMSSGHNRTAPQAAGEWNSDIGRMRTPIVVAPGEGLVVAYLQPEVKKVRVTRTGAATTIVFKKHEQYPEGGPARLVVVKRPTAAEAYASLSRYLRRHFFHKRPHRAAFGVVAETYGELHMRAPVVGGATVGALERMVARYAGIGVRPSTLIFGSGFWRSTGVCEAPSGDFGGLYRMPTIDGLTVKEPELAGFMAGLCRDRGIYTGLGMRHHATVNPGNGHGQTGEVLLADALAARGVPNPFRPGFVHYTNIATSETRARLLDTRRSDVMQGFVALIRERYAPVRAIKEDEMTISDLRHLGAGLPNLPDGEVARAFRGWNDALGGDVVILGRNDWFGVGTDGQNGQGYVDAPPATGFYRLKPAVDAALTQVASGYPHPKIEEISSTELESSCPGIDCDNFCGYPGGDPVGIYDSCCSIPLSGEKEYVRALALRMLAPVAVVSRGFWHLRSDAWRDAAAFFLLLRARLHQYAWDQALRWEQTGQPWLMRPLFIDQPSSGAVRDLYDLPLTTGDPTAARDQWLLGSALLVRPLFSDHDDVAVYFPPGRWRSLLRAAGLFDGGAAGRTLPYRVSGPQDYPLFLREREILVIGDHANPARHKAYVFLETDGESAPYRLHRAGGQVVELRARRTGTQTTLRNLATGAEIVMLPDPYGKGLREAFIDDLIGGAIPAQTCNPW